MLWGRRQQFRALDGLVADVRAGHSRVLVVRGEPGIGKTALLGYAAATAQDFQVARAEGVESEIELPYAALHQLCGRVLDRLDVLPGPQREALGVAFGLRPGSAPDRFLVGLAVLGLLAEVAADRPLLYLVDDAQWLDQASARVLAFVARRVDAESVALIFGTRDPATAGDLAGLPGLDLTRLDDDDARALLASVIPGRLDERVRDRIIAESDGNPLALLELTHGVTTAELAGGFGLPGAGPLAGRIEKSFLCRITPLPETTRRLLLLAAADPVGDPALLWRAAGRLGITDEAAAPAEADRLLTVAARVTFRHPLARSAVYQAAPAADRRLAHRAIAEATDAGTDPDHWAWHQAQAAPRPDEEIAAELERSASRAQARGGFAAAAAFLDRATALTPDAARRGARALAAAQAKFDAAAPDRTRQPAARESRSVMRSTRPRCCTTASADTRTPSQLPSGRASTRIWVSSAGRWASWSRRPREAATAEPLPPRSSCSRNEPAPAALTGRSALRPACVPCSAMARAPSAATGKRSTIWAAPVSGCRWPARTCCTVSGCAARAAAPTPGSSCEPRMRCSRAWGPSGSLSGPDGSCVPPGSTCASAPPIPRSS